MDDALAEDDGDLEEEYQVILHSNACCHILEEGCLSVDVDDRLLHFSKTHRLAPPMPLYHTE